MIAKIANDQGQTVGEVTLSAKTFKTGSTGYFGQGKVTDADGARFQVQIQVVEIGSKNRADKAA